MDLIPLDLNYLFRLFLGLVCLVGAGLLEVGIDEVLVPLDSLYVTIYLLTKSKLVVPLKARVSVRDHKPEQANRRAIVRFNTLFVARIARHQPIEGRNGLQGSNAGHDVGEVGRDRLDEREDLLLEHGRVL